MYYTINGTPLSIHLGRLSLVNVAHANNADRTLELATYPLTSTALLPCANQRTASRSSKDHLRAIRPRFESLDETNCTFGNPLQHLSSVASSNPASPTIMEYSPFTTIGNCISMGRVYTLWLWLCPSRYFRHSRLSHVYIPW